MANKTIGDLSTTATAITGAELMEIEQSSASKKAPLSLLMTGLYAKISDTKSNGTDGGTFTSGALRTRDLQTEDNDASGIVSIAANQFTLQSGTYRIRAVVPFFLTSNTVAILRNITDSTDTIISTVRWSGASSDSHNLIVGQFTIGSAKTFEIQQICGTTRATNGFGVAAGLGYPEVYTVVELWKVA